MGQFRVNELLISQNSSDFHAGGPIMNKPKISHDGRALDLDVEIYDVLHGCILKDDFIDDSLPQDLQNVLIAILNVSTISKQYSERRQSPIMSMAFVLLVNTQQDHSQSMEHASSWLCYTLASAIFKQLISRRQRQYKSCPRRLDYRDSTSDSFLELVVKHHAKEGQAIDRMLDLFEEVLSEMPDEPWPSWSRTSRKFDMNVRLKCITEATWERGFGSGSEEATSERSDAPKNKAPWPFDTVSHWLDLLEDPDPFALGPPREEKPVAALFEPPDPEIYAHFTKLARAKLAWRNIFVTVLGHIGSGPKWLAGDEHVMLVCGADVPYVFTPLEKHQRARVQQLRHELEANDKEYYAIKQTLQTTKKPSFSKRLDSLWYNRQQGKLNRLDKEKRKQQHKLDLLTNSVRQPGTYVLQGEVYVEGIMHGEGVGLGKKERITVT